MKVVKLKTLDRESEGTSGARRMRRAGRLPAVVYGDDRDSRHVSVSTHDFERALTAGARVLDLEGEAGRSRVLLKDVQYDSLGTKVLHVDFLRVNPKRELELRVPLDLFGVPKGLADGGVLMVQRRTVAVKCLPGNIPENIRVDLSPLELGQSIEAGSLELPEKVMLADDEHVVVCTVAIPRGQDDEEEAEAAEGEAAEGEAAEGGAKSEDSEG